MEQRRADLAQPQENLSSVFIDHVVSTPKPIYDVFKRVFDISLTVVVLVPLLPIMLLIAVVIFLDDPKGSPFFIQDRCGKDGKVFRFIKFRSMVVDAEDQLARMLHLNEMQGPAFKIKEDPRITRMGRFIRRTSIDELPQFINVLRGEMSIVGPRPPLPREVGQYTEYQQRRLQVKPGLTCFWQCTPQRNNLTFDQWLDLDLKYIRERSFFLDIKLICNTIKVMFTGEGQ